MPSSEPSISPYPTGIPTKIPTGIPSTNPTSMPSISFGPTVVLDHVGVIGNVTVDRNESEVCTPTELRIHIAFDRTLVSFDEGTRQSIYLDLPGFTNGPCTKPKNGFDFAPVGFFSSSAVSLYYYEGNYTVMFRDSKLRIYLEGGEYDPLDQFVNIEIVIDKNQGFRFQCMQDTSFAVSLRTIRSDTYYAADGFVDFLSFTPRYCFLYNSSLAFYPPHEQKFTSLNLTLQLATDFKYGDNITLYLPGFTNAASFSSSHTSYSSWGRTSSSGGDASLVSLSGGGRSWSRYNRHGRVQWVGFWNEGTYDTSDMYGGSSINLWIESIGEGSDPAFSFIPAGEIFYILVDRANGLSSYCGRPENYTGFQISVQSDNTTLVVPLEQLKESDPIGAGCPLATNSSRECLHSANLSSIRLMHMPHPLFLALLFIFIFLHYTYTVSLYLNWSHRHARCVWVQRNVRLLFSAVHVS
jgi:hypothetical protein